MLVPYFENPTFGIIMSLSGRVTILLLVGRAMAYLGGRRSCPQWRNGYKLLFMLHLLQLLLWYAADLQRDIVLLLGLMSEV